MKGRFTMSNWIIDGKTIVDTDAVKAVSDVLGVLIDGTWVKLSPNGINEVKNAIHIPDDKENQAKDKLREVMSKK